MRDTFGPAIHVYTVVRPGEPAGEHAIVDTNGHVHSGYDAAPGTLVLVRPDGYVALTADTADRVTDYWSAVWSK